MKEALSSLKSRLKGIDSDYVRRRLPALVKNKIAYAVKNPPALSVGFRAGTAILLAASVLITCCAFYLRLSGETESRTRFNKDAGVVCSRMISEYGSTKTEAMENGGEYRMTGLSFVRSIDFDADGKNELLIAFKSGSAYQAEVWGYDSDEFKKLYSQPANSSSNAPQAGYWLTIYRRSGKTYLGSLSKEDQKTMELFSLHGGEFKSTRTCAYDPKNDIYAVDGKINTSDFETVRLSNLTADKAELVLDSTSGAMEKFAAAGEASAQSAAAKTPLQLMNEAYYEIIEDYTAKYGEAEYDSDSRICRADGLCAVELIDFNADGTDELLVAYRYGKKISGTDENGNYKTETEPEYKLEIYSFDGSRAQKIFENDGASRMQDENAADRFYILRLDGNKITGICKNTYNYDPKTSRIWTGTSRISEMNADGRFETVFSAEVNSNYGYLTYRIDGERVYRREFNKKGYAVPYFCNEDEYDDDDFRVVYLQGSSNRGSDINKLIRNTQSTVEKIRSAAFV